jgi:enediyne biosynthesis protein E4
VYRDGRVHPVIYRNLGAEPGQIPRFQETGFVHRPDWPAADDYRPGERSNVFFDRLVANRRVMYFAVGQSGDFDGDGRLDLLLASWFPQSTSLLLRNETPAGNYLVVEILGSDGGNRMGIGAVARAYAEGKAGDPAALLAAEEIATGYGYCSGQPPVAHLGLGRAEVCDMVVTLPHGRGTITRRGVAANQRIRVETIRP